MLQDDPLSSTVTFVPLAKVPSLSLAVVPLARRLTEVVVVAVEEEPEEEETTAPDNQDSSSKSFLDKVIDFFTSLFEAITSGTLLEKIKEFFSGIFGKIGL